MECPRPPRVPNPTRISLHNYRPHQSTHKEFVYRLTLRQGGQPLPHSKIVPLGL
ncbi:hypothetical protein B0H17DRAFT_1095188, partial [Mycena rosella]